MEKHKITTLFLDIGGVLLTDGWGREQRQNAIDRFDLDTNETNDRNALLWDTYEMDKLTLEDYLNYVIFFKERPFSKEEFVDFMYQQSQALEGALEYFKTLKKERGYKIVALSNEARDLNEHRIKKYKLNELFDFYVSSCYVRMRKPDPHMYKLAFDTAQIHPYQSVYIDDRLTYIEMARELGIPSLHYQGLQTAKDFFENC